MTDHRDFTPDEMDEMAYKAGSGLFGAVFESAARQLRAAGAREALLNAVCDRYAGGLARCYNSQEVGGIARAALESGDRIRRIAPTHPQGKPVIDPRESQRANCDADMEKVMSALHNLLGQVEQARIGFGIYQQSKSMDEAVADARAIIFGHAPVKETK